MEAETSQDQLEYIATLLVTQTGSIFPWKRKEAEEQLEARAEEFFEPLLRLYEKSLVNYFSKSIKTAFWTTLRVVIIVMFAALEVSLFFWSDGQFQDKLWASISVIMFLLPVFYHSKDHDEVMDALPAKALTKYRDLRIVGPLASALAHQKNIHINWQNSVCDQIETALVEALPQITSEDDVHLTSEQVGFLARAAKFHRPALAIAILQAMPYVGNAQALAVVRSIARGGGKTTQIVGAAQDCLPALEARVARLNIAETLLRPSSPVHLGRNTLLRPVNQLKESSSEELLRAFIDE